MFPERLRQIRHRRHGELPLKHVLSFECSFCEETKNITSDLAPGYQNAYGGEFTPAGWTWIGSKLVCFRHDISVFERDLDPERK